MKKIEIPKFDDKDELFDFLAKNESALIAEKKHNVKEADPHYIILPGTKDAADKASTTAALLASSSMQVKVVINTTNIMDSHSDVHIPGLWKKSIRDNGGRFNLLQEHIMKFDHIISDPDQVKAFTEMLAWKALGFGKFKGDTEALIFDALIEKSRNEFMFNQYAQGFVKNHSVGMRYVKLFLAMNSESVEHSARKEVWDKFIDVIVNKKDAENQGFFWAVTQAKIAEGSAVVKGSNIVTPTMSMEAKSHSAPPKGTHENNGREPSKDTRKALL